MSFSRRGGHRRPSPPRDRFEEAPEDVRLTLFNLMVQNGGALRGYRAVCRILHQDDSDIWSESAAWQFLRRSVMEDLEWFEVMDLLESYARSDSDMEEINEAFVRCGLAYAIHEPGTIDLWDPAGEALKIAGLEFEATSVLSGRFEPVRQQYERGLTALHGRPMDLEKAVSESVGALEAVVILLTGKKEFGAGIDALFAGQGHRVALGESLKKLYGWASQVPGARHGRVADSGLTLTEARAAVRLCGVAIGFLVDQYS